MGQTPRTPLHPENKPFISGDKYWYLKISFRHLEKNRNCDLVCDLKPKTKTSFKPSFEKSFFPKVQLPEVTRRGA